MARPASHSPSILRVGAQTAAVCGEWNDWSADVDVMRRDAEGGFSLTVDLEAGRAYRNR